MKVCVLFFIFISRLYESGGEPACASMNLMRNFQLQLRFNIAPSYLKVHQLAPVKCVETCMRSSVCKSVNFNMSSGECQLYHQSSEDYNKTEDTDFIFTDVKDWPLNLASDCSNHTCPNNTICVPDTTTTYTCIIVGCLWTSGLKNISTSGQPMWETGFQLYDFCSENRYNINPAVCKSNGQWNVPNCKRVATNCANLKKCNPSYGDGEYWLYNIKSRKRMRIYCYNMTSENPLEFISLYYPNMASKSIYEYEEYENCTKKMQRYQKIASKNLGETIYFKVRIGIFQLAIHVSNAIFSNSTGGIDIDYGMAFACSGFVNSSCSALGRFKVDLRNTSFSVISTSQWSKYSTASSYIGDIKISFNNQVVEGFCGGSCGGCIFSDRAVKINDNSDLDQNSAVDPQCTNTE